MSQGIGKNYFLKFQKEIISNGCIGVPNSSGQIVYGRIPRYFNKIYRKLLGDDRKYSKFVKWYTKNVSNAYLFIDYLLRDDVCKKCNRDRQYRPKNSREDR